MEEIRRDVDTADDNVGIRGAAAKISTMMAGEWRSTLTRSVEQNMRLVRLPRPETLPTSMSLRLGEFLCLLFCLFPAAEQERNVVCAAEHIVSGHGLGGIAFSSC